MSIVNYLEKKEYWLSHDTVFNGLKKTTIVVLSLMGVFLVCSCSSKAVQNKKGIEEVFSEQYSDAKLCSIEKVNGMHSKEGLLSFIESYDDTYNKAFDVIAIPSEVKKVLRSEKERALDFVNKASFEEYDNYVVYYLNNSQDDTLHVDAICDHNTQNVAVMYKPSKYVDGKFVEDEAYTKWEDEQIKYKETYAAVERYADFATLIKMLMEEDNRILYAANMKQIQDFIIKYY